MSTQRIGKQLEAVLAQGCLTTLVSRLHKDGLVVCVDFGSLEPLDEPSHCLAVARPGAKQQASSPRRGLRHTVFYSCVPEDQKDTERIAVAEQAARLSKDLRLRAYRIRPSDEILFQWDPDHLWHAADGTAEEKTASLVVAVADDGSSIVVRGEDDLVNMARNDIEGG